jgi:hypothetical protein
MILNGKTYEVFEIDISYKHTIYDTAPTIRGNYSIKKIQFPPLLKVALSIRGNDSVLICNYHSTPKSKNVEDFIKHFSLKTIESFIKDDGKIIKMNLYTGVLFADLKDTLEMKLASIDHSILDMMDVYEEVNKIMDTKKENHGL